MRQQSFRGFPRPLQALSMAAAACLLAACGGAGVSAPAGTTPIHGGYITIVGTVNNASGAPVSNATITLGTTSGPPATTQSDMNGNYSLPVDTSTVNTGTTVVVTVASEGYQTCVGTVNTATGMVTGCEVLPAVALGELYPAVADAVLVRLGDGEVTGGAANSKLQIAAPFGLSKTIPLAWPANFDNTSFQTFTLRVSIRGMQANSCANKVTVLQGATAGTATELRVFSAATNTLSDSDALGELSSYALPLAASAFSATGGNVYVKMEAGACADGTPADPSDDYEFVGLYGKFS